MFARVYVLFITLYILDVGSGAIPKKSPEGIPIKAPAPVKGTHSENVTNVTCEETYCLASESDAGNRRDDPEEMDDCETEMPSPNKCQQKVNKKNSNKQKRETVNKVKAKKSHDRTVFPESIVENRLGADNAAYTPKVSGECKKIGICEDDGDYPVELAEKIIAGLTAQQRERLNIDIIAPDTSFRFGGTDANEVDLCRSDHRVMRPTKAQKLNSDEWYYVLNRPTKLVQGIRAEICLTPGSSCNENILIQQEFQTLCKQNYVNKYMGAISKDGKFEEILFKVPSCCTCVGLRKDV